MNSGHKVLDSVDVEDPRRFARVVESGLMVGMVWSRWVLDGLVQTFEAVDGDGDQFAVQADLGRSANANGSGLQASRVRRNGRG